jgi:Photosynthesis system II assembly factor YCF48
MRAQLLATFAAVNVVAGCGNALAPPVADSAAGRACPAAPVPWVPAGLLTGVQFVSAARGWVVGQGKILATADGGRHWRAQYRGQLNLTSVDFVNKRAGWAVGTGAVLATSDGGARWAALPEPCPVIRSVHFVSPGIGFAVAGGRSAGGFWPEVPEAGGVILATSDGGHSWRVMPAPADAQTICFSDPRSGWLGAGGRLYRTTDGGRSWVKATPGAKPGPAGHPATMIVQCAGPGSAWAVDVGPGAASSQQPHVGYHAGPARAVPIFAEQYFPPPGARVPAPSPGSYAGPFSAISPSAAAFIDWCPACGPGTAPWDLATRSGARLTREGNVGGLNRPEAASFLSPRLGWVVGIVNHHNATGITSQYQRIVFTKDAGHTWQIQYTSPSTG